MFAIIEIAYESGFDVKKLDKLIKEAAEGGVEIITKEIK